MSTLCQPRHKVYEDSVFFKRYLEIFVVMLLHALLRPHGLDGRHLQ